jgi:dihydropteroate synthase
LAGPATTWRLRTRTLDLSEGVLMGVLNVTPDSFSDGGRYIDETAAITRGLELIDEGAGIVDVGGESTRPGANPIPPDLELQRVVPVIEALAGEGVVVSIDTSKPSVAEAALVRGAEIVNDVAAASAPGMVELVAASGAAIVLMHMQGTPPTMQVNPEYDDVVSEVEEYLVRRLNTVAAGGVAEDRIAVDPGLGFGKTLQHNLELFRGLDRLSRHAPVVLGTSRKGFLGALTGIEEASQRDLATAVTTALGFARGARVFRVHDVGSSRQALTLANAMVAANAPDGNEL